MTKKKENEKALPFDEDYLFMSWRYCIGRHTIAAQCHAGTIANDAYGKLSPERTQFNSEDINQEIHDRLHWGNFIDMGWYGNIPKSHFRPLDVVYSILAKEEINSFEKIKNIKTIQIDWNREKNEYDYSIYYFNQNDGKKDLGRSFHDIADLEVWQRLANLFDLKGHKWCRLTGGSVVEYYEYWTHYTTEKGLEFKKIKCPIDGYHNFAITTRIDEQFIEEDNLPKPTE